MINPKEKELIIDYLNKNESFKLSCLCEYLIENGSKAETFSSGKYKIYPLVGVFLNSYVHNDILDMEHIENDVIFKKVGEVPAESQENENIPTAPDSKLDQLSLF